MRLNQFYLRVALLLSLLLSVTTSLVAAEHSFSLHKLTSQQQGPTALIIGGIQGDEPGGFHAATLLVTHYKATKGELWVVPNLNFTSILQRSRGVYGDMNRKFHHIDESDPDYESIKRIQALILSNEIDFIFNLHDGSGFYRPKHIDRNHNPDRWGQSLIIDQEKIDHPRYANLEQLSNAAIANINQSLLSDEHVYHVKNTKTRLGDAEMEKTLTYFAIKNGKPAVGIETSKSLPTHKRAYYHLLALESYLQQIGISLERQIELKPNEVKQAINSDIRIAIEKRLMLALERARSNISYFPLQRSNQQEWITSNPLLAIIPKGKGYQVSYGNRRMTVLSPQFFDFDASISSIPMNIDGTSQHIDFGSQVTVKDSFRVEAPAGYRVNVIGWRQSGVSNETGVTVNYKDVAKRFSIDRDGKIFRVEVYRDDQFSGMVLVHFTGDNA